MACLGLASDVPAEPYIYEGCGSVWSSGIAIVTHRQCQPPETAALKCVTGCQGVETVCRVRGGCGLRTLPSLPTRLERAARYAQASVCVYVPLT